VATRDRELMETCWELGIEARFPEGVEEDLLEMGENLV